MVPDVRAGKNLSCCESLCVLCLAVCTECAARYVASGRDDIKRKVYSNVIRQALPKNIDYRLDDARLGSASH